MSKKSDKIVNLLRRKNRIKKTITGSADRPRLTVYISNKNVSAQLIDDESKKTVLHVTTLGSKDLSKTSLTAKASWVGEEVAKKAKAKKIKSAVLDRNGRIYHGRIKALADSARNSGLEI